MALTFRGTAGAVGAALLAGLLVAPDAGAETLRLGLGEALERARAASPLLRAAALDLEKAGGEVRKARSQRVLPEARVTAAGGLVPGARGDVVSSPDTSRQYDDLGPFYRLELKLVQPLWTFGKLEALEGLARTGLEAQAAKGEMTLAGVELDAARAYWALAATTKGAGIAADMRRDFDELQREVEKRLKDETSGVDDADLLRVKASGYGVDRIHLEALEARRLAGDAFATLLALPAGTEPEAVDEPQPAVALDEAADAAAVARAVETHVEVRALAAAERALAAKVELARRDRNPVVYLAAGAGYAHAANRDVQDNPWVDDAFNFARVGAELGLSWDANLHRKNIDVALAAAERGALAERLAGLRAKVGVEVRQALRAAARERALLDSARASLKAAKSRLRLVLDNWETGLGEVEDVIDAYEKYYTLRVEEPQREHALNVALARLGYVLGDFTIYLEWVRRGNVDL